MAAAPSRVPLAGLFARYPVLADWRFVGCVVLIAAVAVAAQQVSLSTVNNYVIFRQSFVHLMAGADLYARYPAEHVDLYKYSPTFALFMAPFAALPLWLGVLLWTVLNALAPLLAVYRLPISGQAKAFVVLFSLTKLVGALQNTQSNGLVLALMIGVFVALEARRPVLAALATAAGAAIKLFGGAAGILFIFCGGKRRFIVAGLVAGALLLLAPAPLIGLEALGGAYKSWFALLAKDEARSLPSSLVGFLGKLTGTPITGWWVQGPGLLLLALPLLRRSTWSDPAWRLLMLAHVLVWVIVFNHQTESPTLVIALVGTALWGIVEPPSRLRTALLFAVFTLTALSSTDLFPASIRNLAAADGLRILPLVAVELAILRRLLARTQGEADQNRSSGEAATKTS